MDALELTVESRTGSGKGEAHKLRAKGRTPAVVYGKGFDCRSISFVPSELKALLKTARGRNSVIRMNLSGQEPLLVMVKDIQVHPVSREIEHTDFLRVYEDAEVPVSVPLHLEGRAEGVVAGGTLKQLLRLVPLRCLPKDIPVDVKADVTALKIGESLHVRDVVLPAGTRLAIAATTSIATVEK